MTELFDFASLSLDEVHAQALVIPVQARESAKLGFGSKDSPAAQELSVGTQDMRVLRDAVAAHVESMGRMELSSPLVRDVYLNTVIRDMLERAAAEGVGATGSNAALAWTMPLGDVCMVVLATEADLQRLGVRELVEIAHEDAVRAARDAGKPHNALALSVYDARAMSMSGQGQQVG
ncbi:MAG: hypothetical protein EPN79_10930 [Burkholderiaceae bacterium]|nr:MAG: hypothetical protein EPN79_10930 [Burkholderiaceae bacterium]TBR76803.1 MAG: hypothetical protein EPN64_06145 [Burkholderiaceae bacterium]